MVQGYSLTVFAKLLQLTLGFWAIEKHGLKMKREFLTWMLLTLEQILEKKMITKTRLNHESINNINKKQ